MNRYKIGTDGYSFGDRLMEGVRFYADIVDENDIWIRHRTEGVRVENVHVHSADKAYFRNFNMDMWLEKAAEYLLGEYILEYDAGVNTFELLEGPHHTDEALAAANNIPI